jgi:branched-chain amino acid transport system ATP-binding protein
MIETRELDTYYGASHVLHAVSVHVRAGETLALMGRNGMGKTTLIRSMLGFARSRRGDVLLDGRSVMSWPAHRVARAGIAYVPEGRGIFPNLTVRENLVMAARSDVSHGATWTLERVLATFPRLAQRLSHGGAQLSGGEQQMLSIGRALMVNPRLIILDEATEGLAPLVAREIWTTVRAIKASGMAVIIVDKNFAALTALVDRCVILVKGRKVFDGTPAMLEAQPGMREQHLGV